MKSLVLLLSLALLACGDDDTPLTGDTGAPADTGADTAADTAGDTAGDTAVADDTVPIGDTTADTTSDTTSDTDVTPPAALRVVHVWSADGSAVSIRFDRDVAMPAAGPPSPFEISDGDGAAVAFSAMTGDGGQELTLVLDTPLDAARTYDLTINGVQGTDGAALSGGTWTGPVRATIHLNLIWHQHQPSYLDPASDQLQGPWVRKHAQKDYFDMTAILRDFGDIHFNVNLTSSLLNQLQLYIDRLGPYVDLAENAIDEAAFLAAWGGKTDPWIDLLLADTPEPATASAEQLGRFYADVWSTHSIAEPLRAFFPEYQALIAKANASYTRLDLLHLKLWFELAWMDPDFLRGPVTVYRDGGDDVVVDLSDVVSEADDGTFRLHPSFTDTSVAEDELLARGEALANRLVAENYKLARASIEIHKELAWDGTDGQVEVLTTPYFHPILPLLYDTNLARQGQPADTLPEPAFAWPEDAALQIAMAVEFYTGLFGRAPRGMWPSEGAVAEEIIPAFRAGGIDWIATDRDVLLKGKPGASHFFPYRVDEDTVDGDGGDTDDEMMVVFRDTELSDKVGFFYQSEPPIDSATDFVLEVLEKAPRWGEERRLLSVILDGENAWEWYTQDHDAKQMLRLIYQFLTQAHAGGAIITVTGSEYVDGNAARGVPPNPVNGMAEYEDLFPGSWIGGRLDTWIGEVEENIAWSYLVAARADFEAARATLEPLIGQPASLLVPPPAENTAELAWWNAWRAMLSAEGSDWFWWYGSDQTAAGGDDSPFDTIFRAQLSAMYGFANAALADQGQTLLDVPAFAPVLQPDPVPLSGPHGTVPVLDGAFTPDDSEWTPPGGLFYDNDSSGAQNDPNDDIGRVFYAYSRLDDGRLYFGLEFKEDLEAKLGTDYKVVLYTSHGNLSEVDGVPTIDADPFNQTTAEGTTVQFTSGGPARRVVLDFSSGSVTASVQNADGAGAWTDAASNNVQVGGPVAGGAILEVLVLMTDLGMRIEDPLEYVVLAVDGGVVVDTAPNLGTRIMFADPTKLVNVTFELDATGSAIDLSTYVSIADPPPPAGTGMASIVGNQDVFAQWTPNSVFMADDGVAPDASAGDNIWTIAFPFVPGTDLQYKYTIGSSGQSWGGTEEFPLTNRGYSVPSDGTRSVRIRDVFADRPDPSGSQAAGTMVFIDEE